MPKFEKKYCHCVWDDELKGKRCFVADEIDSLQRVVEVNDTQWILNVVDKSTYAPFPFASDTGIYFRFCYHDPYYELKLAREEGKVIQRYWNSEQEWDEYIGDDFPDDISFYRIKPDEQKKVFLTEEDLYFDPHYEVKLAFERGKKIECKRKGDAWEDWDYTPAPEWLDDHEYRIKPEEPKPVTNRELARWLAQGNGEFIIKDIPHCGYEHWYNPDTANRPVTDKYLIRRWKDTEWHEPTREYMGLD